MSGRVPQGPADRSAATADLATLREIMLRGPLLFFRWRPQPPDWRIEFLSENTSALLGYPPDDFLSGRITLPALTHPDDLPRVEQEVVAQLAARRPAWSQEYRVRTRAGDVRWFRDWNHAAYDDHAGPRHVDTMALDVTDLKQAEENRLRSDRRYRQLYESLRDAYVRVDMTGRLVEFNQSYLHMLDYTPDELAALTYVDLTPAAWHEAEAAIIRDQVMTRGFSEVYEKEYRRKDGTVFPVELRTFLVRDGQGAPDGLWAIVRDITQRKAIEAALRASEARYRLIVETAQEGIWLVDAESRTTFVNARMAAMLGCTVEEMGGRPMFDFMDDDGRRLAERNVQRRREGIGEQHEFRFRRKDGQPVWTLIETNPLRDEHGAYQGALAMVMDITQRRQTDLEQRAFRDDLQRMRKAESLGLMAGGMAHDFNNILTAITGNLDLALAGLAPTAPLRAQLLAAQQATDRAAELCRHMLTFSGGGHLEVRRLDLRTELPLWREALVRLLPAGQRLAFATDETPLPVDADPVQLRYALEHIVRNAAEAGGGNGGIEVSVRLRDCTAADLQTPWIPEKRPAGSYVEIRVVDQGAGMSTDALQHIFDPFYTTKFTGRGLGLPTVLGILRMHRGVVTVDSALGRGTTVCLLLPAARAAPAPARDTCAGAPSAQSILVADDEPAILALCRQMLRPQGFHVLTAADGEEAVRMFRAHADEICCVLLDVTMPRLSGAEALREIRKLKPGLPAVVASGYGAQEIAGRFSDAPFDVFLPKPFNSAALRQAVRQALHPAPVA